MPDNLPGSLAPAADAGVPGRSVGKTARLDAAALEADGGASATRRKTIRVKRPGDFSVGGVRTGVSPGGEGQADMPVAAGDRPGIVYPILTVAAILVAAVVLYMQSAQAFGRNVCMTPYSYAPKGVDLSWPGKLVLPTN